MGRASAQNGRRPRRAPTSSYADGPRPGTGMPRGLTRGSRVGTAGGYYRLESRQDRQGSVQRGIGRQALSARAAAAVSSVRRAESASETTEERNRCIANPLSSPDRRASPPRRPPMVAVDRVRQINYYQSEHHRAGLVQPPPTRAAADRCRWSSDGHPAARAGPDAPTVNADLATLDRAGWTVRPVVA